MEFILSLLIAILIVIVIAIVVGWVITWLDRQGIIPAGSGRRVWEFFGRNWKKVVGLGGGFLLFFPLLMFLLVIWYLLSGWSLAFARWVMSPPAKLEPVASAPATSDVPWKPEELRKKYWFENAKLNGWVSSVPDVETVMMNYALGPKDKEGPVRDSKVNTALMEGGGRIKMVCENGDVYYHDLYFQLGEEGEWRLWRMKEERTIEGPFGALRLKAVSLGGPESELRISIQVSDPPGDQLLISSRGFQDAGKKLRWGILPSAAEYDWQLYVRLTRADGTALPKGYLLATPAVMKIVSPTKKLMESFVSRNETVISSKGVTTTSEEKLYFDLPVRPGDEFRLDVKLLILPKGGLR